MFAMQFFCCQFSVSYLRFCFNKDYQCPSTNCDVPMLDHSRKMVYRKVCVEIVTQSCVLPVDDGLSVSHSIAEQTGTLLAWHYCPGFVLFSLYSGGAFKNILPISQIASVKRRREVALQYTSFVSVNFTHIG